MPGPLTTTESNRRAMLMDWGSWDSDFAAFTREVCDRLVGIAVAHRDAVHCFSLRPGGVPPARR